MKLVYVMMQEECVHIAASANPLILTSKLKYQLLRVRYTTVSQPESIDGWLAVQLGDKLWFPCWESRVMINTAARIVPIIAAQERAFATLPPANPSSSSPPQAASIIAPSSGTHYVTPVTDSPDDSVTNASSVSASLL